MSDLSDEDQLAGWRIERQADGSYLGFLGGNLAVDRRRNTLAFPSDRAAMEFVLAQKTRHTM